MADIDEIKIIPLSAMDHLSDSIILYKKEVEIYQNIFKKLLKEGKDTNSIAFTGNYGIGKSSVLRTIEREEKFHFLYLTVNHYLKDEQASRQPSLEQVENDLLTQIMTKCKESQLPIHHGMRHVKGNDYSKKLNRLFALTSVTICIMMLYFNQSALRLFLDYIHHTALANAIEAILGVAFIFMTTIELLYVFHFILYKDFKASADFQVGSSKIVMESLEDMDFGKYAIELTYIFEHFASHRDYDALVFEDFDRLTPSVSCEIMRCLKNMNDIVNARLANTENRLKFIYVTNDYLLSHFQQEKIFDYILPLIPSLGIKNSFAYASQLTEHEFIGEEMTVLKDIFDKIDDYRTVHSIVNQYEVFREVSHLRLSSLSDYKIMMLAILKVLYPAYYYEMLNGVDALRSASGTDVAALIKEHLGMKDIREIIGWSSNLAEKIVSKNSKTEREEAEYVIDAASLLELFTRLEKLFEKISKKSSRNGKETHLIDFGMIFEKIQVINPDFDSDLLPKIFDLLYRNSANINMRAVEEKVFREMYDMMPTANQSESYYKLMAECINQCKDDDAKGKLIHWLIQDEHIPNDLDNNLLDDKVCRIWEHVTVKPTEYTNKYKYFEMLFDKWKKALGEKRRGI